MAETTVTIAPSESTVQLNSTWYYELASSSTRHSTYRLTSGPTSAYQDITFDLTSISEDKGILDAVLTWTATAWASSGGTSINSINCYGTGNGRVYPGAQNSQYAVYASEQQSILTYRISPGQVFTVRLWYQAYAPSTYTLSENSTICYGVNSCLGQITYSNISLEVTYGDKSNNPGTILVGVNGASRKLQDWFVGISGKARKVQDAYVGINGIARKIYPGLNLSYLHPGEIVQIDELGNGVLQDWIVMGQDHYSTGTTVLMRKVLLPTTGKYASSGTSNSVDYVGQSEDTYLNTTWKNTLSAGFRNKLKLTTIYSQPYDGYNKTAIPIERYIWGPAAVELRGSEITGAIATEGSMFDYFNFFTTNTDRIGYDSSGTKQQYWTRTLTTGTTPYAKAVGTDGTFYNRNCTSSYYYRPIINLDNTTVVSSVGTERYDLIT